MLFASGQHQGNVENQDSDNLVHNVIIHTIIM